MIRRLALVLLAGALGCARELPGDPPPARAFYFPVSVSASADGHFAYVVSSNFDLRYNAGWVSVVDLDHVVAAAAADPTGGPVNPREAITGQVRLLSLAGAMATTADGRLAAVPHRGSATLSLVELSADGATLSCGDGRSQAGLSRLEELTDCDRAHLVRLDEKATFPEELGELDVADPFSAAFTELADTGERLLAVGHLIGGARGGRLSVFDVPAVSEGVPSVTGRRSVRLGDANGLSALVVHPDASGAFLVGTSKVYSSTQSQRSLLFSFDLARTLAEESDEVVQHSVARPVGGYELSGLTFAPDGLTAYATNRAPDGVVVFDSSLQGFEETDGQGVRSTVVRPRYQVLGAAPAPGRPTGIVYLPRAGGADLLAVSSLEEDAVFLYAVNAAELQLVGRLDEAGLGPYGVTHVSRNGRELLLVSGFFDHTLSVIDVTAASPLDFRVLARLRSSETPAAEESRE